MSEANDEITATDWKNMWGRVTKLLDIPWESSGGKVCEEIRKLQTAKTLAHNLAAPMCVCGHPKSEHTGMSGDERYCKHYFGDYGVSPMCLCQHFRAELDWPDSEGWWWCRGGIIESIAYSRLFGEEFEISIACLRADYYSETEFNDRWSPGPARFTKLLEQNPPEAKP